MNALATVTQARSSAWVADSVLDAKAHELAATIENVYVPQQFDNPSKPEVHLGKGVFENL